MGKNLLTVTFVVNVDGAFIHNEIHIMLIDWILYF